MQDDADEYDQPDVGVLQKRRKAAGRLPVTCEPKVIGHQAASAGHRQVIPESEIGAQAAALAGVITELANAALALLETEKRIDVAQVTIDSRFVGRGYGLPTEETVAALKLVAELEGVLLDPVYSAKAMGGLIEKIRQREFSDSNDVVFVHTGGTASLPVYREAFS